MIDWQPIETAPRNGGSQFSQPRVMVWLPETPYRPGCAAFAYYDPDSYAKKPRPYWSIEGERTTDSRNRQPTHWAPEPNGPTKEQG